MAQGNVSQVIGKVAGPFLALDGRCRPEVCAVLFHMDVCPPRKAERAGAYRWRLPGSGRLPQDHPAGDGGV